MSTVPDLVFRRDGDGFVASLCPTADLCVFQDNDQFHIELYEYEFGEPGADGRIMKLLAGGCVRWGTDYVELVNAMRKLFITGKDEQGQVLEVSYPRAGYAKWVFPDNRFNHSGKNNHWDDYLAITAVECLVRRSSSA